MPDILFRVGAGVWIFGYFIFYENKWRVVFTKNTNTLNGIDTYDWCFEILESITTKTKNELSNICDQTIYQIKNNQL